MARARVRSLMNAFEMLAIAAGVEVSPGAAEKLRPGLPHGIVPRRRRARLRNPRVAAVEAAGGGEAVERGAAARRRRALSCP
jgi:hypothetical protein